MDIRYQDHLIVAGGENAEYRNIADINILDLTIKKWNKSEPLSNIHTYHIVIYNETMYLVGEDTQTVLRAHVPTLISGAKSGVWETLPNTPYLTHLPSPLATTSLLWGVGTCQIGTVISPIVFKCMIHQQPVDKSQ